VEVKISQIGQVKFAVQSRSHTILCDQPQENGGEDAGMMPTELLLASLGSCTAFYAAQYLQTRNLAHGGVEVTITAEKLLQPARYGNFRIHVACPVSLTEEQTQAMLRAVRHCTVHNTLLSTPEIGIEIEPALESVPVH
jgi:putative redox protein